MVGSPAMSGTPHADDILASLRHELERRGCEVAADTVMLQRTLQLDVGGRPVAVFQIAPDIDAAMHLLIGGRWPATMPARVLVLAADEAERSEWLMESLGQMDVRVLLAIATSSGSAAPGAGRWPAFPDLDVILRDLGAPALGRPL
jgi:hypothetical protein